MVNDPLAALGREEGEVMVDCPNGHENPQHYQFCGEAALWPEILHKIRRSQLYTTAKPATVIKVRTTTVASCG
jgi:hypothetical protein